MCRKMLLLFLGLIWLYCLSVMPVAAREQQLQKVVQQTIAKPQMPETQDYRIDTINLDGKIDKENISFELIFSVKVEQATEIKMVSGMVCEIESQVVDKGPTYLFGGRKKPSIIFRNRSYYLVCPQEGEYDVKFRFASKVTGKDKLKSCQFYLLPAISRNIKIDIDTKDIELTIQGGLNLVKKELPKENKAVITAILPPEGEFCAQWKRHIEKIAAELVTSVRSYTVYEVLPGTVKMSSMLDFNVIQGELTEMKLGISPDLNILNVKGSNVQDWRLDKKSKNRTLVIKLSREYDKNYNLGIEAEKILTDFPCKFTLPIINPVNVLRTDGLIAFGTNRAVKLIIDKVSGMNQIDNRSFSLKKVLDCRVPGRTLFTYRFSGTDYGLVVNADNIIPAYSATLACIDRFKDEDLTVRVNCKLDIKDAPLRELLVEYDSSLMVTRIEGRKVLSEDYELLDTLTEDNKKILKIPFQPETIGSTDFNIYFEKSIKGQQKLLIPELRIKGARNVRGFLLLAADKGLILETNKLYRLRPVHTGTAPIREPGLQLAYRFKDQSWGGEITIKHQKVSINSEVFHLTSIGEGTIYGSSVFTYHIAGAPVDKIRFKVNPSIKNLEFSGRDIVDWKKVSDKKGMPEIWELNLREKLLGDYTLLASYEIATSDKNAPCKIGDISTETAESENGFIVLTSHRNLKITDSKLPESVEMIELSELPNDYRCLINNPVLRAYRCNKGNDFAEVIISNYAQEHLLDIVVDHNEISTKIDRNGEAVTTVEYRIKNSSKQFLALQLPKDAKLWAVSVNKARKRLSSDSGRLLVPLPRYQDVNVPIAVKVTYAQKYGELGAEKTLNLTAPVLEIESMFCRWTVEVPQDFNVTDISGNLKPKFKVQVAGVSGMLNRMRNLIELWVSAKLHIPWLLASLAGLLLAACWGKRKLRIIGTVLGVVLILISFITFAYSIDHYRCFPQIKPFPIYRVVFSSLFNLPQDTLNIKMTISDMESVSMEKILMGIFLTVLAIVFFAVSFFQSKRLVKSLAVAIGITLLFTAASQWLLLNALSAFILAVLIPSVFSVALWILIFRKSRYPVIVPIILLFLLPYSLAAEEIPDKVIIDNASYSVTASKEGIKVKGDYQITAKDDGEILLVSPPAVIIGEIPENEDLEIVRDGEDYVLKVKDDGEYSINIQFLLPHQKSNSNITFQLPTVTSLKNSVDVTAAKDLRNLSITSPNAVSFTSKFKDGCCEAQASFVPGDTATFLLSPQLRNVEEETTRFFANVHGTARFISSLIEITHIIDLQIAQGETSKFSFDIPKGMSVTSVEATDLGAWKYEPNKQFLEVLLSQPHHGNFRMTVVTQIANRQLPYNTTIETLKIRDASRQHGAIGLYVSQGLQVQVENVKGFNRINNSDLTRLSPQPATFTLKKAYRYHLVPATLAVKVIPVKPELRVYEECQISYLGERVTFSSKLNLDIAKAGIFSVSIELPAGFEINKMTGSAIQHWDEVTKNGKNMVIIHFASRVLGKTDIYLELEKMGKVPLKPSLLPRIRIADTKRLTGELTVSVERGTQMEIIKRQGMEIKSERFRKSYKNVLHRFDLLRPDWLLEVSFQVADPWIQVENLLLVRVKNGFAECTAFIHYTIENTDVKRFRIKMPSNTDTPEIIGRDIAGVSNPEPNIWEVELHRKIGHSYKLKVFYRIPNEKGDQLLIEPVTAQNAALQKGYVTVFAEDSLQIKLQQKKGEITSFDSRKIPASFRAGQLANAVLCFRTVGTDFNLSLDVIRHKTAKMLRAEISKVTLDSVVSPEGRLITVATVQINNIGNETFLRVKLPEDCIVWSVFVDDDQPVNAARENEEILIPLKQSTYGNREQTVKLIYSMKSVRSWQLNSQHYIGPSFTLPLRNVIWNLYLPDEFDYRNFTGTMEHIDESFVSVLSTSINDYDEKNTAIIHDNINKARNWLRKGNSLAANGQEEIAKEAYQNAINLAENDYALKNDIQGQQIKMQRQQAVAAFANRRGIGKKKNASANQQRKFTPRLQKFNQRLQRQLDFQTIKQQLSGTEVKNLQSIYDKIFMQQRAAVAVPHPLRITIPKEGKVVTFERRLQITEKTPMNVGFEAKKKFFVRERTSPWKAGIIVTVLLAVNCLLLSLAFRKRTVQTPEETGESVSR